MSESNTITIPKADLKWLHDRIDHGKAVKKSLSFLADLLAINAGMDADECEGLSIIIGQLAESLEVTE